ncbi:MAG: heparinase II/III-family protein [Candidatus Hydrogenedentes bacterium]|nr:heparinase II/III-family protein [Candidatus Hydrogenedentota bacterium]
MRIVSLGLVVGIASAVSAWAAETTLPYTVEQLQQILAKPASGNLIPELESVDTSALAQTPRLVAYFEEAASKPADIPLTTYTLYRRFRKTGERPPYERPYFGKRELLTNAVMAAWLSDDPSKIDRVNDLIWNVCEETTWVAPAHESDKPWFIDLFAAETGSDLAHALYVLGDRLPEEVRNRVRHEIETRIFTPYLEHAHDYWWDSGRNNWTGVCAGSVGEAFLLLETDPARLAQALSLVLDQLARFERVGFEEDGVCLEGIGYWVYGLTHYVSFAEMLRVRTGGAIDLLASPRMKAIATYPAAVALDKNVFASFADSHEHGTIPPYMATRLAERTGVQALMSQVEESNGFRLGKTLRDYLWAKDLPEVEPIIEPVFLPNSGIAKLVGSASGKRVVFAVKAGNNNEPHNNNDVGSFILRAGGQTYLCDPGAGLYSKDYFSAKRYENIFANSYGHSVPRIGGQLQPAGADYKGTLEKQGDNTLKVNFARAYELPELTDASHTFTLQPDGVLVLDGDYAFNGAGLEVEEAFITWLDVTVDGATARIQSPEGALSITADQGELRAERLEEACKANNKSQVLTRITLAIPAASKIRTHFTFTYGTQ